MTLDRNFLPTEHKSATNKRHFTQLQLLPQETDLILSPPSKLSKLIKTTSNNSPTKFEGLDAYSKIGRLGEGTYGTVYMAFDKRSSPSNPRYVALKRIKMCSNISTNNATNIKNNIENGFPLTSIREIRNLQQLFHHPNIITLHEILRSSNIGYVYLVFEYFEHDLSFIIDRMHKRQQISFQMSEIKCIAGQLLSAMQYAHAQCIIHRDIKLSNILMNNCGHIVLADWGLSRMISYPITQQSKYTSKVVTLWYRAPELLFGCRNYHTSIDMWSFGCIFAELLICQPLLPGMNELEQLLKISELLGCPNYRNWPAFTRILNGNEDNQKLNKQIIEFHEKSINSLGNGKNSKHMSQIFGHYSGTCLNLIEKLLTYDPSDRISAEDALNHSFFSEAPLPCKKDMMPTFSTKHKHSLKLK